MDIVENVSVCFWTTFALTMVLIIVHSVFRKINTRRRMRLTSNPMQEFKLMLVSQELNRWRYK